MKKDNGIVKNALILFVIALILSALLGFINQLTKDTIAEVELQKKQDAYAAVYENATFTEDEELTALAEQSEDILEEAGYDGIEINEIMLASGDTDGYVLDITTSNGYGGDIELSIGVDVDGTLTGLAIISNSETAGLGANCTKESFTSQFAGIQAEQIEYTKTGKTESYQIDAISSATITTKAVTNAVNAGLYFVYEIIGL